MGKRPLSPQLETSNDLQPVVDIPPNRDNQPADAGRTRLTLAVGLASSLLFVLVSLSIVVSASVVARRPDAGIVLMTSTAPVHAAAVVLPSRWAPIRSPAPSETVLKLKQSISARLPTAITVTVQPNARATLTTRVAATSTARQLRIFHRLWDIVNGQYIYPDFHGVNWPAARTTLDQAIRAGISDDRFYSAMRDLISSLKDDHSSFLSPGEVHREQTEYLGTGDYVGVGIISDVNLARKYAFVLQVLPGSPAEAAGIRPHDHILNINSGPSVGGDNGTNTSLLRGIPGSTVTVTVQSPGGEARQLALTRADLPTGADIESRLLPGRKRIGYMLVPTFYEVDLQDRVRTALQGLMASGHLDGLIVDMRINGGGAYPALLGNLAFFTHGNVGALEDNRGNVTTMAVKADPIGSSQTVTMAVLIGPSTQSYAEVFSGVLQSERRAVLIGQRSAGNIETLRGHLFEDGSMAWIAEEAFKLPDGANWEGKGLTPDVLIDKAWDEYTTDTDPMIAAAVKALGAGSS